MRAPHYLLLKVNLRRLFIHSSHVLADPTSFEEPLLETSITVIINGDGALNCVLQSGLAVVGDKSGETVVASCVTEAKKRCAETRRWFGPR